MEWVACGHRGADFRSTLLKPASRLAEAACGIAKPNGGGKTPRRFAMNCFFRIVALAILGTAGAGLAADATPMSLWERDTWTGDWGGLRPQLADHGVVPTLNYIGEVLGNVTGGSRRTAIYEGLVTLSLDVDLQKLAGWSGAKVHIQGYNPHGAGLTQKALGDIGLVSNIDAYDTVQLFTFWLEQSFSDNRFSIRAGILAEDDEFYQSLPAAVFVHSNFGEQASIGLNIPIPAYPIAGPGVRLRINPYACLSALFAAYGGNPASGVLRDPSPDAAPSTELNKHGTHWAWRRVEGALFVAEVNLHFNDLATANPAMDADANKAEKKPRGLSSSYKVGVAYHTDTFSEAYDKTLIGLSSSLAPAHARARGGDWAIYAMADQELSREPGTEHQGLSAFVHASFVPPDRNAYDFSGETGFAYTGLLPGRTADICGLGVGFIHASSYQAAAVRDANRADGTRFAVPDFETVIEATYNARLAPWLWLQPDVQLILHAGGSSERGNALVIGLRSNITF